MEVTQDRSALYGLEGRLFKLVSRKATSAQWAEWLRTPLEHALAEGDGDLAMSLLKAGANGGAGWKGCDGRTLLDAAAEGGSDEAVSAVLKIGRLADLNAVSGSKNMTALHRASKGGHTAVAQMLVVEGADVGLVDSDQRSALHYALEGGHEELARHVMAAGPDLNAKDRNGDTPLHLAAALRGDKLVCTLLRRGVGVNKVNNKGHDALHVAVSRNRIDSAEALLEAGANPNHRYDRDGVKKKCSPLCLALRNLATTEMLLKHGANVKEVDELGRTALHSAAQKGLPEVIDALVEAGAELEARSAPHFYRGMRFKGLTPLHGSAKHLRRSTMAALLHKGANIHAKDRNGLTPLHVVCKVSAEAPSRAHQVADFLLRRGADETLTDNDGHSPEDLIEISAATRSLQQLLSNAPADRTWRRRGMLVLCRAHSAKVLGGLGNGKTAKMVRRGKGRGAGSAADESGSILRLVVGLEAEEVFRAIVGFL